MKQSRPVIGVILIFLLGILSGALGTHLWYTYRIESIISGSAHSREEYIVSRLGRKLVLDDRQKDQVRAIVHETKEAIKALRKPLRPQTEAIIEKSQAKILVLLNPEQQRKFQQIIAARKEKLREKGY